MEKKNSDTNYAAIIFFHQNNFRCLALFRLNKKYPNLDYQKKVDMHLCTVSEQLLADILFTIIHFIDGHKLILHIASIILSQLKLHHNCLHLFSFIISILILIFFFLPIQMPPESLHVDEEEEEEK